MSYPVYYVPAGDVLPHLFASNAGSTGASSTLSGLAVTDIEIYKDGSTTQRASDSGYTLLDTDGIDFDGVTGINGFSIDTGDNTDAGFYTVGAWFHVVVSSVTVDSQTVNFVACAFRIMPAESVAGKPKVDTDTFGGTAGTFSGGRPEVNTTHWGGTATGSVNVNANVAQISGDSTAADNAEAFFDGTGYAGTNNVIPTVTTLTNLPAITANWLTAAGIASDVTTELQNGLATASAVSTLQTSVDDLPTNAELATALAAADDAVLAAVATVDTVVDAIKAKTDSLSFTVAGQVDANIQYVNDVAVTGDGQAGTEWGPA